jgi:hypothetical protein
VLASLLTIAGCKGPSLVFADTVEGTLTLDGRPVPNALVQFYPEVPEGTKAPSSSGTTDDKGFFRLTRSDVSKPGALVGRHKVIIAAGRAGGDRDNPEAGASVKVPKEYTNANTTPFTVEVTQDKKTYDLPMNRAGR